MPVSTFENVPCPSASVVIFCEPSSVTSAPLTVRPVLSFTSILSGMTVAAWSAGWSDVVVLLGFEWPPDELFLPLFFDEELE